MVRIEYITALHIIFVVSWFAGLFYLPRLFIYHVEAMAKPDPDRSVLAAQFKVMQRKLWYIITWPAAVLTVTFGIWRLTFNTEYYLTSPWFHLKLGFVLLLLVYHFTLGRIFGQLQRDEVKWSSIQLRLLNELATILLIAIVFVVELKDTLSWLWGVAGIFIVAGTLTVAVMLYKKRRAAKGV
ncbi:MAG: CopD family protein [Bacteroidota bacterium]